MAAGPLEQACGSDEEDIEGIETGRCDASAIYAEPLSPAYEEFRNLALAGGVERGADYVGGRRVHTWAKAAGFEVLHTGAYQPQYRVGPHKGFWNWTFVEAGVLSQERLAELAGGMKRADEDPGVSARKPLSSR